MKKSLKQNDKCDIIYITDEIISIGLGRAHKGRSINTSFAL